MSILKLVLLLLLLLCLAAAADAVAAPVDTDVERSVDDIRLFVDDVMVTDEMADCALGTVGGGG